MFLRSEVILCISLPNCPFVLIYFDKVSTLTCLLTIALLRVGGRYYVILRELDVISA